jgi:hypothetical protein
VYSVPEQVELRKISSNDYSGATVIKSRNSTCQHSSVRSFAGLVVTFQALRILSYGKNYFAYSRKMTRENDDKQTEDKPPGEEIDTITRLVVRM